MKKSWLITGISVLLFVGVAGIAIYYFSPAQKLQRHGYSATESTVILEKVNPETVTIILSHDHHIDHWRPGKNLRRRTAKHFYNPVEAAWQES